MILIGLQVNMKIINNKSYENQVLEYILLLIKYMKITAPEKYINNH